MSGSTDKTGARRDWPTHVRFVWPWIAFTLAVLLVAVLAVLALHFGTSLNVEVLTVDPAAEVGLAPYVGVISHIGVLLLWSAATVCFVGSRVLRHAPHTRASARCLGVLGVMAAWLAIDDLFLLHEEVGLFLAEGLDRPDDRSLLEAPVFLLYGVAWVIWLVRFRSVIVLTPYLLLGLSLLALGFSVAVDLGEYVAPGLTEATPWMATTLNMLEEFFKLGGIIFLLGYAMAIVTSRMTVAASGMPASSGLASASRVAGSPMHLVSYDGTGASGARRE